MKRRRGAVWVLLAAWLHGLTGALFFRAHEDQIGAFLICVALLIVVAGPLLLILWGDET